MWSLVFSGVKELISGWFAVRKSKQEAEAAYNMQRVKGEQDWDIKAMEAARYSWKDEFLTVVWFFPLVYAWHDPDAAMQWVDFVSGLPYWYQFGMFGILAASFGLRWYFKNLNFSKADISRGKL